ncbi:MAG: hypothetical protein ACLFQ6_02010 [Candidatus Sumerlaeia bacterium]
MKKANCFVSLIITFILCTGALSFAQETWEFDPPKEFTREGVRNPIDLRYLNEKTAGESGFVRLSDDGNGFVRGDGVPLKFWGVMGMGGKNVEQEALERHARFLAKMGVNMVRIGGASAGLIPQEKGAAITDINEAELDKIWRTIAAMKKEGIYIRISPFWDHGSVKYINPDWGIEGYKSGDSVNALLYFEPTLQKGYKAWMKRLFTDVNPYTGIAIKDDPAVAIVQVVSEDSLFFWWLDRVKGGPLKELEHRFALWAIDEYGSVDKAIAAWDGSALGGDSESEKRLQLHDTFHISEWSGAGNRKRVADQVRFMAQLEHDFYAGMKKYFQEELGAKQLIGPSNFGSADAARLSDLQRWAWTAGDVIEQNDFFGTEVAGQHSFWRIQAGHFFQPKSALHHPEIPARKKHVVGKPYIVSSTCWTPPNLYYAEGPILNAAYGSMNGLDGFLWFAAQAEGFDLNPYFRFVEVKGSNPMKRWTISNPSLLSQFPAAALIFRKGYIDQADTVIHEVRTMDELKAREAPLITEEADYDPLAHLTETSAFKSDLMTDVRPEAYLIGRVEIQYGGNPKDSKVADLDYYIRPDGEIHSTHEQLKINPDKGILKIDAPMVQGVVGFLKEAGGDFEMSDVRVETQNDYAAILALALDEKPLARSESVLVQVGTQAFPTGWQTQASSHTKKGEVLDGVEIVSTGDMPWRVVHTKATLTIANSELNKATLLDEMGFPQKSVEVKKSDGKTSIALPPETIYLVLEKE